jgi:hypothetical protein
MCSTAMDPPIAAMAHHLMHHAHTIHRSCSCRCKANCACGVVHAEHHGLDRSTDQPSSERATGERELGGCNSYSSVVTNERDWQTCTRARARTSSYACMREMAFGPRGAIGVRPSPHMHWVRARMADPPPGRPPGTPGATAAHVQLATDEDPSEWAYSNEYSDGEGANDQPITYAVRDRAITPSFLMSASWRQLA